MKSFSFFNPNRLATSASCMVSRSTSRLTCGTRQRGELENMVGYLVRKNCTDNSSERFSPGATAPGKSKKRTGSLWLISVNKSDAFVSHTFGNTSTSTSSVSRITPFSSKIASAPTRCCPSKMETDRVGAAKISENADFVAPAGPLVLTAAVPSAREITPGTANLSSVFISAIVTARAERNALCCSYTFTNFLSASTPAFMAKTFLNPKSFSRWPKIGCLSVCENAASAFAAFVNSRFLVLTSITNDDAKFAEAASAFSTLCFASSSSADNAAIAVFSSDSRGLISNTDDQSDLVSTTLVSCRANFNAFNAIRISAASACASFSSPRNVSTAAWSLCANRNRSVSAFASFRFARDTAASRSFRAAVIAASVVCSVWDTARREVPGELKNRPANANLCVSLNAVESTRPTIVA
mmetsp:Transcript_12969/g.48499  ORF Transcript_12969/g.48499 Transcript_12969/m.48499 type:complete len:412 (+) Transcript_12969:352-1587(+)